MKDCANARPICGSDKKRLRIMLIGLRRRSEKSGKSVIGEYSIKQIIFIKNTSCLRKWANND